LTVRGKGSKIFHMRDKKLERNIEGVKQFISMWQDFSAFLNLPPETEVSEEEEKKFMEIKSAIARKCQQLQEEIEEGFPVEGKIIDILSQSPTLGSILRQPMHLKKLQNDWHSAYISINKLLGSLEAKREALAKVSRVKMLFKKLLTSPLTSFIIMVLLTLFFYTILARLITPEKAEVWKEKLKEKLPFLSQPVEEELEEE